MDWDPRSDVRPPVDPPASEARPIAVRAFAQEPRAAALDLRTGLVAALIVLAVYLGVALSVDFPRVALGFQSDEATYYMMGHSLAQDFDLAYRREDLARVWQDFPTGPLGVFLKRGSELHVRVQAAWPPVVVSRRPDPDPSRLYYGKSFIYPLLASPFVRLFGTNGFLVFHALLLAGMTFAAYLFLHARSRAAPALLLATAFVFATIAPVYAVWITPELFNLALVTVGYCCWLFKEVAPPVRLPRGLRWLRGPASDVAAAVLLGIVTFSKPSTVLLVGPLLAWVAWKRRWGSGVRAGLAFAGVVAGLFALNVAVSGEWNFQGGERVTCYAAFPFQTATTDLTTCMDRATNRVLTEVIFDWHVFWTVLWHNVGYVFIGRYSGLVAYFFPAVFALVAFALARRRRLPWQHLVLAAGVAEILIFLVWTPYTYSGGGGSVGNRYFMSSYGVFLFLLPPVESIVLAMVPWIVGALFTAHLVLNPFYSSFFPADAAKHGPLRLLPVELSLVNDLPIDTKLDRVRVPFGSTERFQLYFLDDNAYPHEEDSFWTRGRSSAEMLVKTSRPVRKLVLTLAGGPVEDRVTVRVAGFRETVALAPGQTRAVTVPLGSGFPYQGTRVWHLTITCRTGFVPMFAGGGTDNRFLGVRVKPDVVP